MKHLLIDPLYEDDLGYEAWLEEESIIHQWLLNNIHVDITNEFLHHDSTCEVWEYTLEAHSKQHDLNPRGSKYLGTW